MRVWHYTIGRHFRAIIESGELRPASIGVHPPELPVLWFSANRHFEMTARKAWRDDFGQRVLSVDETRVFGNGLYRFAYESSRLIPWRELPQRANIPAEIVAGLKREAQKQGADPREWYGAVEPIAIAQCEEIESMTPDGKWIPHNPGQWREREATA